MASQCLKAEELLQILNCFNLQTQILEVAPYGSGHINDTFLVQCKGDTNYILQRVNHEVFLDVPSLMENVMAVTGYLRERIIQNGGDPERETLNYLLTKSGEPFCKDAASNYWRLALQIRDTVCLDAVRSAEDFYNSAVAFGNFQYLLAEYPAHTLHETIVNFHNTRTRFDALKAAIAKDPLGRVKDVQKEIDFALARQADGAVLVDLLAAGELPLRVTHNDTKLNNVMLDTQTGKAVCVIDLDTVMPGLAVNDFGDSIRFGASTATEDEQDLSKVQLDLNLYRAYTQGFLEGCQGSLTQKELEMLPMGAKIMCLECGVRFLTDYIDGDHYFRIHRPGHNVDRCRTQFKLVEEIEKYWSQLADITAECAK